ncbi:MAG: hypothetical protein LBC43_00675 [Bifidobacteriaceae bacterium]|jgi:hypothetical protein|nr:hypothetical protein [Bifidobacteriaceae bacterium]
MCNNDLECRHHPNVSPAISLLVGVGVGVIAAYLVHAYQSNTDPWAEPWNESSTPNANTPIDFS